MLPQKFDEEFKKLDINIHEPKNLLPVELHQHRKDAYKYNRQWEDFWKDNSPRTKEEILKKMRELNRLNH